MAWIVCCGCHHVAELKPLPKNARFKCSACGSRAFRAVRVMKTSFLNGGQTPADQAKVMTFAGLLSIARERGYKVGWAAMKYKIIYGIWPEAKDVEPARPSGEILWWIKKQNIAYAKARRAEEGEKPIKPALPDSPLMTEEDWQWLGR